MEGQKTENCFVPEGFLIDTEQNKMYSSSLYMLERAMKKGIILEGIAKVCDCTDMSLRVDFGFAMGIIPREEAMLCAESQKDIAIISRVGKPVQFMVKAICECGGHSELILSRRMAQRECMEKHIKGLSVGDIIPSVVTHLDNFGAFVDIGCGIVSLICIDSISVSRIFHPSDRLTVGERIMAVVKEKDNETGRIYMSLRELLGTWEENAEEFSVCSTVPGVIRSIEPYGVFVELSPNLAGLAEFRDDVKPGEYCSVYIKNILPDKMKIKLVIIDTTVEGRKAPLKYFVDTNKVKHLDYWRYSPENAKKTVETKFI